MHIQSTSSSPSTSATPPRTPPIFDPAQALQLGLHYQRLGLNLIPLRYASKTPEGEHWNSLEKVLAGPRALRDFLCRPGGGGLGLLHSASGTATLDIDHGEWTEVALEAVGLRLSDLTGGPSIVGKNGAKPLFRVPPGLRRRALVWPDPAGERTHPSGKRFLAKLSVFELRAGLLQDVLPPSVHPDTMRPYGWRDGPPRCREDLPELPQALLELWRDWDFLLPRLRSACPWAAPEGGEPTAAPRSPQPGTLDRGSVITRYKERTSVRDLLRAHGYRPVGDKWLYPGFESGIPGVIVHPAGGGRSERAFSFHAGDPLCDEKYHDAFDIFTLLEHGGDLRRAVRAAAALLENK